MEYINETCGKVHMYNVLGPKRKACGIDVFQYAYEGLFILGFVEGSRG